MIRSLRTTLLVSTITGTALVLACAGVLLFSLVQNHMMDQFDRSLTEKARLFASTVEQDHGRIEIDIEQNDLSEFEGTAYLQFWAEDGSTIYRSVTLEENDLDRFGGPAEKPLFQWVPLPDGKTGRAVGIRFKPRVEGADDEKEGLIQPADGVPQISLVLARETESVQAALAQLKMLLFSVGFFTIAFSAGVLWLVIRRNLKPLNHLASRINRLDENDLSETIALEKAPAELLPVVDRLNNLLHRMEEVFSRERSFSAEVAHELRTPLAGLRSTMEVATSKPRRPDEYEQALHDCTGITIQMHSMVEILLSIARLEARQIESNPEPVVLSSLLKDTWNPLEEMAQSRGLHVHWDLEQANDVNTDPSLLQPALRNILDNAVCYSNEGGYIRIETVKREDHFEVRVINSGSRIPKDQVRYVTERFWQGDKARSSTGGHCGLGLTLVQKIASLLGGSVRVESTMDGEFKVTLSISNPS